MNRSYSLAVFTHQYLVLSVFNEDRISSVFDRGIKDTIWFDIEDWFDKSGEAAVDWRYAWKVFVSYYKRISVSI